MIDAQERDRDVQGWALVCDTLLTRAASPGTVFQVNIILFLTSKRFKSLTYRVDVKNTPFSAEAGGYLVALHRTAPPPPCPHRGDHRPQVQQVRPQNELGDLGLVLNNFCELRIIRRETLATTLAAL